MRNNRAWIIKMIVALLAAANLIWLYAFEYRIPGRPAQAPALETASAATTEPATEIVAADATEAAPEEEVEKETEVVTCRVTAASSLRVRSGPGTEYEIITSVKYDEILTVLGSENGWIRIRTSEGQEGYVSSQYVEILE